jgi:hypothetical protein
MRNQVRTEDWQHIQRGVYATFSGKVTREARLGELDGKAAHPEDEQGR